jgi:hypothetical protein
MASVTLRRHNLPLCTDIQQVCHWELVDDKTIQYPNRGVLRGKFEGSFFGYFPSIFKKRILSAIISQRESVPNSPRGMTC